MAEPLELFQLKCADHCYTGDMTSTHFKWNNPMVCRVTSQWNHQILDRSSVPRTKARPEIQSPLHFYNIIIVVITNRFLVKYYKLNWNKFIQALFEDFKFQRTLFRDGIGKDTTTQLLVAKKAPYLAQSMASFWRVIVSRGQIPFHGPARR
jgi:hypothetical protein